MKHKFKAMTFSERHGGSEVAVAATEEPAALPTVRIEMPEKLLKALKIGSKVEIKIQGSVTELSTEFTSGLTVKMSSVEIPGNPEVKALL